MEPCNQIIKRSKIPKDVLGPHGMPECQYTSRVSNSRARYEHYIKKLRALETENRRGVEINKKEISDTDNNYFFLRSDRRNLINNVAHRVDNCMATYEQDLNDKRKRLQDLLQVEEEANIRKIASYAQEIAEIRFQKRIADLLAKRKNMEHEESIRIIHLQNCSHVRPCISKVLDKEAAEIQLYQIREKQMRKMAEAELDKMWHELAMKEADALSARLEYDEILTFRRQKESIESYIDKKSQEREKRREILKQEAILHKAQMEEVVRKSAEELRIQRRKTAALDREQNMAIKERHETLSKQQAEAKIIEGTWKSITDQHLGRDKVEKERRIQRERDLVRCNVKMVDMKNRLEEFKAGDDQAILKECQNNSDAAELLKCQVQKLLHKNTIETSNYNEQAAIERREQELKERNDVEVREFEDQIHKQLNELVRHKQMTDAQANKLYQKDLWHQMEYSNLLKERAKQEELDQIKKGQLVKAEYEQQIKEMTCRTSYSDHQHPFITAMASGLKLKERPDSTYFAPNCCIKVTNTISSKQK